MTREESIMMRLEENNLAAQNSVRGKGYIIGTFLYGSQNYNIDTEESDVDSIALFCPSEDYAILNPATNWEIETDYGKVTIKDTRKFVGEILKQSPNSLEILFTNYKIRNFYFDAFLTFLYAKRDELVRLDRRKMLFSSVQNGLSFLKRKPFKGKYLANAIRMLYFAEGYFNDLPFEDCLKVNYECTRDLIIRLKTGEEKVDNDLIRAIEKRLNDFFKEYMPAASDEEILKWKDLLNKYVLEEIHQYRRNC